MKKLNVIKTALACAIILCAFCMYGCGYDQTPWSANGNIHNGVIFVNFKDGVMEEGVENNVIEMMNTDEYGMRNFFKAESLGRCIVSSINLGTVTLSQSVEYYQKGGEYGYNGEEKYGKEHIDGFYREQMLIREALSLAKIPSTFAHDGDSDGFIDGITFVFNTEFVSDEEKILWPHKSRFYEYGDGVKETYNVPDSYFEDMGVNVQQAFTIPKINGVSVGDYIIVSTKSSVGEICHEFSHVLGLPDYYSYIQNTIFNTEYDNIGDYDLMGAKVCDIPQYSLAYVRSKVGWLKEGEHIAVTGESSSFTLQPVTDGGVQAIKIMPENFAEKGEFFMVEVRRKEDVGFDSGITASGVLIYSVRPENAYRNAPRTFGNSDFGNMYGHGNFEVKLFTTQGLPLNYFSSKNGRNALENIPFADGELSGISIRNIADGENDSFSFDVVFEGQVSDTQPTGTDMVKIAGDMVNAISWQPCSDGKMHVMAIRATPRTAASFLMHDLPSSENVAKGIGEREHVLYYDRVDALSRLYIPKLNEQCYIITVLEDSDGNLYDRQEFVITIQGQEVVNAAFGDILAVAFRPGNTAFIVVCVFCGLFVLVGIILAIKRAFKEKRA